MSENSGGQKEKRKRRQAVKVEAQRSEAEETKRKRASRKEAAAEIEAGGRRKEIADEAIRETACVKAERLTPPFHEEWRKTIESRRKRRGFFVL